MVGACIFGAPPTGESSVRFYASGPRRDVDVLTALFAGTRVDAVAMDGGVGKASALKLTLSTYNKISWALAAVAYGLADHHGLHAELVGEAQCFSQSTITDPGRLPSVTARAWRWEPEMAEAAQTLAATGLPADFARAAEAVLGHRRDDKDDVRGDLRTVLRRLRS